MNALGSGHTIAVFRACWKATGTKGFKYVELSVSSGDDPIGTTGLTRGCSRVILTTAHHLRVFDFADRRVGCDGRGDASAFVPRREWTGAKSSST